jgi:hypothetical protein
MAPGTPTAPEVLTIAEKPAHRNRVAGKPDRIRSSPGPCRSIVIRPGCRENIGKDPVSPAAGLSRSNNGTPRARPNSRARDNSVIDPAGSPLMLVLVQSGAA